MLMEVVARTVGDEVFQADGGDWDRRRVDRVLGAHPLKRRVESAWRGLIDEASWVLAEVETIVDAMDRLGYDAEVGGDYFAPCTDRPYFGDGTTTEYLRPHIEAFARVYVAHSTFMKRTGQRSQIVHHDALDEHSGLTPGQRQKKERRDARARERQQCAARRAARRAARDEDIRLCEEQLAALRRAAGEDER